MHARLKQYAAAKPIIPASPSSDVYGACAAMVNTYGGFFGPWAVRGQFLASLRGQFVLWIMLAGTVGRLSNTMQVLQVPCYPTTSLCR